MKSENKFHPPWDEFKKPGDTFIAPGDKRNSIRFNAAQRGITVKSYLQPDKTFIIQYVRWDAEKADKYKRKKKT